LAPKLNASHFDTTQAKGEQIKGHPVIDQLVKIRVYLEKIKPIEKKLKYQIDKLLKTAAIGNIVRGTNYLLTKQICLILTAAVLIR